MKLKDYHMKIRWYPVPTSSLVCGDYVWKTAWSGVAPVQTVLVRDASLALLKERAS